MENEKLQENVTMDDFIDDIEKNVKKIYPDDIIKGKVISVNEEEILVNIGFYADGIIPKNEFSFENVDLKSAVNEGDEIDVMILKVDDGEGNVLLSKKKAEQIVVWDDLKDIFEKQEEIELPVKDVVKGGVVVNFKGVRGFIPASQLSVDYVSDLKPYVGTSIKLRLIEFDKDNKKVIFSHKVIEQEERQRQREKLLQTIEKGQKFSGKVVRLARFGAFVDLGGVQGLIHNSDLSWKKVKHPSDIVKEGDVVDVYVIDFKKEEGKIALGLKDVNDDPWKKASEQYKVGNVVMGKVSRLAGFGAFVELESGIEGLVHISEISEKRISKPDDELEFGQEVKVKILSVDSSSRKLSLSMKEALAEAARANIPEEYKEEQEIGTTLGDLFNINLD
ncbi:30S ribosomal protein S1 [Vallitalea okinawensis]|uniref:30S ribosomal protein S1 n=1 Tax=Vallitalea okinawensis TaxID=2078660 RepID=UPI000CFB5B30|nr:30S ribosomal protein S1 [Vallitalea okinawensis]